MKIDQATLAYIQNVVKTASLVKIENIIIEPNRVRAIDDNHTVLIFQDTNVPDMPFGSVGISRLDVFSSRLDLVKTVSGFSVEAIVEGDDPATSFARSFTMKAEGLKVEYRAANPAVIRAPKELKDTNKYKVKISGEAILYMTRGQTAMASDEVTIIGNKDGVSFAISDINSDQMMYKFADNSENLTDDGSINFTHRYPIKVLLSLFKTNPDGHFILTSKGMLKFSVNNLTLVVMPKA